MSFVRSAFPSAFIYVTLSRHLYSLINGRERFGSIDSIVLLQILLHPLLLLTLLIL